MAPLLLCPAPIRTEEGRPVYSPHKPRELAGVAEPLRDLFAELAGGGAPWPLYLFGDEGRGKTCAALALADHVPRHLYLTCYELVELVHQSYRPGGKPVPWDDWRPAGRQLVILDEIGSRAVTDTHYEAVQKLLDLREGAGLVLVSNHRLERIAELYDRRIADRMGAGVLFELKGSSRRTG